MTEEKDLVKAGLTELQTVKAMIEDPLFQKYINDPIKKRLSLLGKSYDCKTMHDLNVLNGKSQGLNYMLKLFKAIQTDCDNALHDYEEIE